MSLKILRANQSDAATLTELTMSSKAYWGFSKAQLAEWKEELTITEAYLQKNPTFKLVKGGKTIAYYSYFFLESQDFAKVDNLFVAPAFIGAGYGRLLMEHCLEHLREQGIRSVSLDAEPKALEFYQKFGFQIMGQLPSSIKGRFLPILELKL